MNSVAAPDGGAATWVGSGIERIGGRRGRCLFGISEAVVVGIGVGVVAHLVAVGVLPFCGVGREGVKEVGDEIAIGIQIVLRRSLDHLQTKDGVGNIERLISGNNAQRKTGRGNEADWVRGVRLANIHGLQA